MSRMRRLLWRASPRRVLLEGGLVSLGLLFPLLPVLLSAPPLPRSLYLVQLPLVCALVAGLRLRFFADAPLINMLKELGLGLLLAAGITAIVLGMFVLLGQWDAIRYSYAGTSGTLFFLGLAAPEYLGVRVVSWGWLRWDQLRRRRYAWGLTDAIISVVGGIGLVLLIGGIVYGAYSAGNGIWGIPQGDVFAQIVFWLSIAILFAAVLAVGGLGLFLPPVILFSFLTARKMTVRLEKLEQATQALRAGELSTRLDVQGEDEIAQLQADFNAMAADLETSMTDLQAEKDKVWSLLENRRELVAGISHELRNPIATILGYLEFLQREGEDRTPQEVEQYLQTIQYEATRLQVILNDLLASSQLEAEQLNVELGEVDLTALATRLVETFAALAWNSKRVQVSLSAPNETISVTADPLRLEQIIVNLLQNAIQHTPAGGLITLEIRAEGANTLIAIEDTGEGIAPEDLATIWEKYRHPASAKDNTYYGIGLGLSLVKALTEVMHGSVAVESCPGEGSVFTIRLPNHPPVDEAL